MEVLDFCFDFVIFVKMLEAIGEKKTLSLFFNVPFRKGNLFATKNETHTHKLVC